MRRVFVDVSGSVVGSLSYKHGLMQIVLNMLTGLIEDDVIELVPFDHKVFSSSSVITELPTSIKSFNCGRGMDDFEEVLKYLRCGDIVITDLVLTDSLVPKEFRECMEPLHATMLNETGDEFFFYQKKEDKSIRIKQLLTELQSLLEDK